jgi:hypothetical protein
MFWLDVRTGPAAAHLPDTGLPQHSYGLGIANCRSEGKAIEPGDSGSRDARIWFRAPADPASHSGFISKIRDLSAAFDLARRRSEPAMRAARNGWAVRVIPTGRPVGSLIVAHL